jgi:hypothetical protein
MAFQAQVRRAVILLLVQIQNRPSNSPMCEGLLNCFDKKTLKRFRELEHLEDDKKKTLYDLIDTYIRDAKGRKTYAA